MNRPLLRCLVLLALAASTGCATVKPWERGTLSHPCMQTGGQLGDSYRSHVISVREGATGGEGEIGGGCGCG